MESKEFYKKLKISIFHLYYYLFYNYNPSKISTFLLSLMDIFQLFSINLNERVKFVFIILQNSIFWKDNSKLFNYFIKFIINLNTNPYNSNHYRFFLVTLYCTYAFVFIGIFLFLKLLRDVYKRRLIKEFKVQLSILRYFLLYNIYIFYYPILRKKYII